jgi:hypothetical protein
MAIMISKRKLQPNEFDAWKSRFEADANDAGLPGMAYDERAARRSWNEMQMFLEQALQSY